MSDPHFLSLPQVLLLHEISIQRFGGTLGIRDESALAAAVFHPQNVFFYSNADFFEIAAAYAYHIAEAQCFLDGNKRTAIAAALIFLTANRVKGDFNDAILYDFMIGIAEKRATKSDLAAYLRSVSHFV